MEANVLSVLSTNINQIWGLLLALIVYQTPSLQLAASQTPPVNVTLGTREKMEVYARSAVSSNTK